MTKKDFLAAGLAVALMPAGCAEPAGPGPIRIAVAQFQHETCTFCPGGDTEIEDWTRSRPPLRGEEVLDGDAYVRGFVGQARDYGNVSFVGLESPAGVYGGSSRSWNTRETFEHFTEKILSDLRAALPVDGVYLALHGAMAVRDVPRPEAEIARRVREVVGTDVPIVATFDLHGNEDAEFLRWANGAFVTKRYPHYDARLQGERAARFLIRTVRGDYRPTTATRRPGILTPTVLQWTGQSPSMDIMERARRWEDRETDAFVGVFYGFPWSDVPDVGATVMVMTNDDPDLAEEIAEDMADYMWRLREELAQGDFPLPPEAVRRVREAVAGGLVPVAVGDHSDRSGDATFFLRQAINQGLSRTIFATIRDEHAIEALSLSGAQPGDAFSMEVGGFAGPSSGEPVPMEGTLAYLGPGLGYEQVAAVGFGEGNMLILTPALSQVTSPESLRVGPIDPDDYDVFVVKSRVHFRRGFDETGYARTIVIVEAPGPYVGTTFLDALDYQHAPIAELYPYGVPDDRR